MLRTNAKQVKEAVIAMIMDNAVDWVEDNRRWFKEDGKRARFADIDPTNRARFCDLADLITETFKMEKLEGDNRFEAGKITRAELFEDWSRGLASAIPSNYWTYQEDPREVLGDILQQTKAERERYTEEQSAELLTSLIYREIEANRTH